MAIYQLGKVNIDVVTSEEGYYSSEITERKVEDGSPIIDHVSPNTLKCTIECTIIGKDAGARKATLVRYRKQGDTVHYRGREFYPKMLIKSINSVATAENANGFDLTIQLEQHRATKYKTVVSNVNAGKVKLRPKPGASGGSGTGGKGSSYPGGGGGNYRPNPGGAGGSGASGGFKAKVNPVKKTNWFSKNTYVPAKKSNLATAWHGIGVDGLPMKTAKNKSKPKPIRYNKIVTGTGGIHSVS